MYSQQHTNHLTHHSPPRPPRRRRYLGFFFTAAAFVAVVFAATASLIPATAAASARLDGMALWDIVPDESAVLYSPWPALGLPGNFLTVGGTNYNDGISNNSSLEMGRVAPVQLGGQSGWVAVYGDPYLDTSAYRLPDGSMANSREVGGSFGGSLGLLFGPHHGFSISAEVIPFSADGGTYSGRTLIAGPGFVYRPDANSLLSGRVLGATYGDTDGYGVRGIQVRTLGMRRLPGGSILSGVAAFDLSSHQIPLDQGQGFAFGRQYEFSVTGGISKKINPRLLAGGGLAVASEKRQIVDGPVVDQSLSAEARVGGEYQLTPSLLVRGGVAYPVLVDRNHVARPSVNAGLGYAAGTWRVDAAVQDLVGAFKYRTRNLSFGVSKMF